MKNSPMPPRKKPLQAKTPLENRSELKRTEFPKRATPLRSTPSPKLSGTGLSRAARSPKQRKPLPTFRPRVSREEREGRRLLAQRSGWVCEIGGREQAQEAHHRRNRSQGGTWCVANLLHLCSAHHLHVTTHPQAAREQGWAVRSTRDPADVPVWIAGREFVLLDAQGGVTPINEIPDEESA